MLSKMQCCTTVCVSVETKGDKFVRLSAGRERNVLRAIRLIGNLANRSAYDYDSEQASRLIDTIYAEIYRASKRFEVGR